MLTLFVFRTLSQPSNFILSQYVRSICIFHPLFIVSAFLFEYPQQSTPSRLSIALSFCSNLFRIKETDYAIDPLADFLYLQFLVEFLLSLSSSLDITCNLANYWCYLQSCQLLVLPGILPSIFVRFGKILNNLANL